VDDQVRDCVGPLVLLATRTHRGNWQSCNEVGSVRGAIQSKEVGEEVSTSKKGTGQATQA